MAEKEIIDTELEDIEESEDEKSSDFDNLLTKNNNDLMKAMFEYCFINNIFFNETILKNIIKNEDNHDKLPGVYVDLIQQNEKFKGLTFFSQLKVENFSKIYSEDLSLLSLNEEDRKNRQQVIDILGYDPFKEERSEDRPQLYRDLTSMLTEAMRKDVAKAKAALSIVRSYQNIERYQKIVTELMSTGTVNAELQEQIDQYLGIISKIQNTVNQTAEKNNFTVKGVGANGRGMLSDVMNQVETMGYDKGITNYYDIATSKAIEEVSDISWRSMINQINLSKTDYVDILTNQCELVKNAQRLAQDAAEALRLAKEKITKQELLDELAKEYRKKGISEEEINEFISREYDLFDGKE